MHLNVFLLIRKRIILDATLAKGTANVVGLMEVKRRTMVVFKKQRRHSALLVKRGT